jgi:hypothetical protein
MKRIRADMNDHYERKIAIIMTGLEGTKAVAEHQEVPGEEVAVKSSGKVKKRHRGRHLAAGRRGEPRELTQGNCGPRKELAAAGRKMARCAKVAQRKERGHQGCSNEGPSVEQGRLNNQTRNKLARGIRKGRTLRRRQLMRQEGTNGTKNRDLEEQLRLGSERRTSGSYRKNFGLQIMKRAVISSGLRKISNWALWRGRPPPQRKGNLLAALALRAGNLGAPATRDNCPHRWKKKRKRGKPLDDGDNLD